MILALLQSQEEGQISFSLVEGSTPEEITEYLCEAMNVEPLDIIFAPSLSHEEIKKKIKGRMLVDIEDMLDQETSGFDISVGSADMVERLFGEGDASAGGVITPYLKRSLEGMGNIKMSYDAESFPPGYLPDNPGSYGEELERVMREFAEEFSDRLARTGGLGAEKGGFFAALGAIIIAGAALFAMCTSAISIHEKIMKGGSKPEKGNTNTVNIHYNYYGPKKDKNKDKGRGKRKDGGPFNPPDGGTTNPGPEGEATTGVFRLVLTQLWEAYEMRLLAWYAANGLNPPPDDIRTKGDLQDRLAWASSMGYTLGGIDREAIGDTGHGLLYWVLKESLKGRWGGSELSDNPVWRYYIRRFNVPYDPIPVRKRYIDMFLVHDGKSDYTYTSFIESKS